MQPTAPIPATPTHRAPLATAALSLASACLLAACGGGGGDGGATDGFTIAGTVSGLGNGKTLVLRNNSTDELSLSANGGFAFAQPVAPGAAYAVTVKTQPAGQQCTVARGSGSAQADVSDVAVACAPASGNGGTPGDGDGNGNAPASGLPALVGDWAQRSCLPLGAGLSVRNVIRLTAQGPNGFTWGSGMVQYNNANCAGSGSLLPFNPIATVTLIDIQSGDGIAAHWGRAALTTGPVNHLVWSKLSETELCVVGDASPTRLANPGAVRAAIALAPNTACHLKL